MLRLSGPSFLRFACRRDRTKRRPRRLPAAVRPHVEALEDRHCPSGGYLLVSSWDTNSVLRYDETTGAFVDTFVPPKSGGLFEPMGLILGPQDHNLYVASGLFAGPGQSKNVLRYNGTTGTFLDDFADSGQLSSPLGIVFGPDGNLYVADSQNGPGHVARYDGATGAFLGDFVPTNNN